MNLTQALEFKRRLTALEQTVSFLKNEVNSLNIRLAAEQMAGMNAAIKRKPGRPRKDDGRGAAGDNRV